MFFSGSRSKISQNKASTTCDVFAVACDLKSQIQTIEEQYNKGQEVTEELRRKYAELREVLRLFEMIEDNEKKATRDLEAELEQVLADVPDDYTAAIRLAPSFRDVAGLPTEGPSGVKVSDKENTDVAPETQKPATKLFPRKVIPDTWRHIIPSTNLQSEGSEIMGSDDSCSALSTSGICGGTLGKKRGRVKRGKASDKNKRTSGSSWKTMSHKTRRQMKATHTQMVIADETQEQTTGNNFQGRRQGLGILGAQWNGNGDVAVQDGEVFSIFEL